MVRWNPPTASMIWMHSAEVLVSHHSLAGASTSPASTGTNPCCCPDTASATMRARSEGSILAAVAQGRHQSAGACSRLPSAPLSSVSGALVTAPPLAPAGRRPAPSGSASLHRSCNQTHRNRLRSTKGSANIPWTQRGVSGPRCHRASSPAVLPHCNQLQRKKRAATQNPATCSPSSNAIRPRRTCSTAR